MLDRREMLDALGRVAGELFLDRTGQLASVQAAWHDLCRNDQRARALAREQQALLVPVWQEPLGSVYTLASHTLPYHVLATDGSQIYPDRHQGTLCSLINVGFVHLCYGGTHAGARLGSQPFVFGAIEDIHDDITAYLDCVRHEYELVIGAQHRAALADGQERQLFLCDGSLIFWHLQSKTEHARRPFMDRYLAVFDQFYRNNWLMAGYISLPNSKELVHLVQLAGAQVEHLYDTHIAQLYLQPGQRTQLFANQASITQEYPEHLRTYFTYAHFGCEIVRVELPAWLAHDNDRVDTVLAIIADQVRKGGGYPVSLAEAHEQAVIKAPDREFFYQMIEQIGAQRGQQIIGSRKSLRKRIIGI